MTHTTPTQTQADDRAPRLMARSLTRKLQAQGFSDAQLEILAKEILETVNTPAPTHR